MERIFMNTDNRKTNEPHKFVINLPQRLDLTSPNMEIRGKNMRKQYKNNKFKI